VFWLAVLVTVAFTVWRLVGNLKALTASVRVLGERLTPALEELSAASQETAEHAPRLSERSADQHGGRTRRLGRHGRSARPAKER
jgi:hypothetical protein